MATANFFGPGVSHIANGVIDWDTDTIKVLLTTSAYTPDADAHDYRDDVTNEVTGIGYTAGGVALANKQRTYDAATNEVRLDADDPSWAGLTATGIRRAVFYKSRGGAASADELIGWMTFDGDQTVSNATFRIQLDASGAFKFVVS